MVLRVKEELTEVEEDNFIKTILKGKLFNRNMKEKLVKLRLDLILVLKFSFLTSEILVMRTGSWGKT